MAGEDTEDPVGSGSQGYVFSCRLPHELPTSLLQFSPVPARVTDRRVDILYVTQNTRKQLTWLPAHMEVFTIAQPLRCLETH